MEKFFVSDEKRSQENNNAENIFKARPNPDQMSCPKFRLDLTETHFKLAFLFHLNFP
jgi:hypothetical protein